MVMEQGKVKYQGNYEEISRQGFDVESIMQTFNESLTAKKGQDKKEYTAESKQQDKTETSIKDAEKKDGEDTDDKKKNE
jgi:hypothetical protein